MTRLHNAQDARDLAQEVYLRLLRAGGLESVRDMRAYLYRIAANVVYEHRFRAREPHVSFDSAAAEQLDGAGLTALSDEPYEQVSTEQQLEQLFDRLPPPYQAVFLLHMQEGLSCRQIAARLGLSPHTAKKYLTRAMATLRAAKWPAGDGTAGGPS
jgi:RNA polymerase sigma-70 factor (ECF subfamily)